MKWKLIGSVLLAAVCLVISALPAMAAGDSTVEVNGTVPLIIYDVSSSAIGYNSATILWTTNGAANSQVFYGTESHASVIDYTYSSSLDNTPVITHSVPLTGLSPSTVYHYRVQSVTTVAGVALTAVSPDYSFGTGSSSEEGYNGSGNFYALTVTGSFTGTIMMDSSGTVLTDSLLTTADDVLSLKISAGTQLLDSSGQPLTSLSVTVPNTVPPSSPDTIVMVYDLGPDSATFTPPVTLTMHYDPAALPPGVAEDTLYIAYWDGSAWQALPGTVDTQGNTVTALLSHFGTFALMGKPAPVSTTTTTPPPVTTTTPPGSTHTMTIDMLGSTYQVTVNPDGSLAEPYTISLTDNSVSLTFSAGTIITADGEMPDRIEIELASVLGQQPGIPDNMQPVSKLYTLVAYVGNTIAEHTVFSQPFLLTIHCDTTNMPNATPVFIAYYETATGWVSLNSTFDAATGNVSAYVDHFTVFAGMITKVTLPPTPAVVNWILIGGIIAAVVVIDVVVWVWLVVIRRRRHQQN